MSRFFHRRHFLQASLLTAAATAASGTLPAAPAKTDPDVLDIGSGRQLFVDDYLLDVGQSRDVTRTLNPPHSIRRVLTPDQPWEALGFIFYCSVVDDNGTAKLYHGSYDADKKKHFALATSQDGLTWERPRLGLKSYQGNKDNNLLPMGVVEASVMLDPHAPPAKRYRMIYTHHWPDPAKAGVFVASSPDGIAWQSVPERLLPFLPDSQPSLVWDERLKQYVIYLRAWNPVRTVARVAVSDLEKPWPFDASVPPLHVWGKNSIPTISRQLPTVLAPDADDPKNLHFYTSAVCRYPFVPDVYLAFPAGYLLYSGPEWKSRALTTNDGNFDVLFASSRDGIAWNRWRQPYVPAGTRDDVDLQLVSMGPGMVRRGRWLHQYFVGWPYTHGRPTHWDRSPENRAEWLKRDRGGIYCATQRLDGFVSMDASSSEGTLTTRPLTFRGERLWLNIHTAGCGLARVALLQADGSPIAGFAATDCEVINTDAVDHVVSWKRGANVGMLAGTPIRVQVTLRHAKLFALQFAPVRE